MDRTIADLTPIDLDIIEYQSHSYVDNFDNSEEGKLVLAQAQKDLLEAYKKFKEDCFDKVFDSEEGQKLLEDKAKAQKALYQYMTIYKVRKAFSFLAVYTHERDFSLNLDHYDAIKDALRFAYLDLTDGQIIADDDRSVDLLTGSSVNKIDAPLGHEEEALIYMSLNDSMRINYRCDDEGVDRKDLDVKMFLNLKWNYQNLKLDIQNKLRKQGCALIGLDFEAKVEAELLKFMVKRSFDDFQRIIAYNKENEPNVRELVEAKDVLRRLWIKYGINSLVPVEPEGFDVGNGKFYDFSYCEEDVFSEDIVNTLKVREPRDVYVRKNSLNFVVLVLAMVIGTIAGFLFF